MSDPEAALFYARIGRIAFDGMLDPLDFLHAIETRTRTAHVDYQKIIIVELSIEGPALDWFIQSIQPRMTAMSWAEFRERFMKRFCPEPLRMSYRLRLTSISRGDRSVEDYTREFLRLGRYAEDLMRDQYFVVTTYVTGLGPAFAGMLTTGLNLESVIEMAKEIELRLVRQGAMLDFDQMRGSQTVGFQSTPYSTFQIGSSSQQRGLVQQSQRQQPRYHGSMRHGRGGVRRPVRFSFGATSNSSGQSSGYGSTGSAVSAC